MCKIIKLSGYVFLRGGGKKIQPKFGRTVSLSIMFVFLRLCFTLRIREIEEKLENTGSREIKEMLGKGYL